MQKMQILFPAPVLARLRRAARRTDRPVSELVRRATEDWLERTVFLDSDNEPPPVEMLFFKGGEIRVSADDMKALIYDRE